MHDSYFDYLIEDISLFSPDKIIKSLTRRFRGYPFDKESKGIIFEATEKKYLLDQYKLKKKKLIKEEKRIPRVFKTGNLTQLIIETTGSFCTLVFIISFLIITAFLFNIVNNIDFNSLKFLFFFVNLIGGTFTGSCLLFIFLENIKIKNKFYIITLVLSLLFFFITLIWSLIIFPGKSSWIYSPALYLAVLPFLTPFFAIISSILTFCFIKVILYVSQGIEKSNYIEKIRKEKEKIDKKIQSLEEDILRKQKKLLNEENIELIMELSQKYRHIFFHFKMSDNEIIQANQAIAIGEYIRGLEVLKKHLGQDIQKYPAYHFWQGTRLTEEHNFEEACKHFNTCIKMLSPVEDLVLALCFLYIKNNNTELAEELIKKEPLLSSDNAEKFFLKGLYLYLDKKLDQAALALQKSLSLKPVDNTTKIILLLTLLKIKNYEKMREILKEGLEPENLEEIFSALMEYNQKNYKKSIEGFNKILKTENNHIEALCFRELAKAQIKRPALFKRKNQAQKLISLLPEDLEKGDIEYYSIARLYEIEGKDKEARKYLEKAYNLNPDHPEITVELADFYFNSSWDEPLKIEVMLKAIPVTGGKKRHLRKLFNQLLEEPEVDKEIFNLLEKQYFKNTNYDPLMVKILARGYLKKNTMNKYSTDIYLKSLEINCLEDEEKRQAKKLIAWYDAETASIQTGREELYKNLLQEYPEDERVLFLNCALPGSQKGFIEKNPECFKTILKKEYINSKFWETFKMERNHILQEIIKYYYDNKIYNVENRTLIEEYFDASPRDKTALMTFGEHSIKTGRHDKKSLEAYKEMHRENPEDTEILVALGKAYLACNIINFDTITVLEEIFIKELAWNEAIKVLTDYYIEKRKEGKLKKDFIVLFVWGKYTELKPGDYKVRFYIAEELLERRDYAQAAEKYEEIIALVPDNRDARYGLGECYSQMGRMEEAVEIFKTILNNRDDLETLNKLAEIYLNFYENEKEAIIYYEKLSILDNQNIDILKTLLELYKKSRDINNMIKVQEKITFLEPVGENFATLGHFYIKTNRLEDGISSLEKAVKKGFVAGGKIHLMLAEGRYYMVQESEKEEDWLELTDIISEAIRLGCRDKKLYEMRYKCYLKTGKTKEAVEDRKIFAPHDLDNLYQLAMENEKRKDLTGAKENLIQIYRKDKDFLDVALKLARYYCRERSFDKKHVDIILYAFQNKTSQFLRLDEDNHMINHLHNYYKSKSIFSQEIEFLREILKNKHPYNEGKIKSWIAMALVEKGEISEAYNLLEDTDIEIAKDDLLEAHMRLAEELLFNKDFKAGEEILEKIYLIDPTFKNVGNLLENFRKERMGRFALLDAIGSGANATVYKAFDLSTRNYVAVKKLHRELRTDKEAVNNFKKEYEILEELIHPGIAKVIPESFNKNFFALELLDRSLASLIEERTDGMDLNSFFSVATQIVEALHYMHSKNIIYHDLAPDNIMFAGEMVKFCDLGGAKRLDVKTKKTIIASTEKHYLYASPEQCKHEFDPSVKVDHRSDIYSLGALMYHMLTGKPPFTGPDQALISAHQHSKPSPIMNRKDNIPRQLTSIIFKSLEKNPHERHQSMEEILQELMNTPRV